MQIIRAKILGLSIYKNIAEYAPIVKLMEFTKAETSEEKIRTYTDFVSSVWSDGHASLSEALAWHLKFDDTFIGQRFAAGNVPQYLMDAAALDIRRLSSIAAITCLSMKQYIYNTCRQLTPELGALIQNLAELPNGSGFDENEIFNSYRMKGCGQFALAKAFRWEKGRLISVQHPDFISADDMIGYDIQRNSVIENTRAMINGNLTNNVLLYGDSGTGKSATVKSLINIPEFGNLRLIEIAKNSLDELTELIEYISGHTQKFIIYIDDLSFEAEDKGFSALKTALEGGLERRPSNVAIYVTSNRRHMIRESFADRMGDDVHAKETLEERSSLSARFGLRVAYLALDKRRYNQMVLDLCHRVSVNMTDEEILRRANQWEIQHGGRTPRVAVQLVDLLAGEAGSKNS